MTVMCEDKVLSNLFLSLNERKVQSRDVSWMAVWETILQWVPMEFLDVPD